MSAFLSAAGVNSPLERLGFQLACRIKIGQPRSTPVAVLCLLLDAAGTFVPVARLRGYCAGCSPTAVHKHVERARAALADIGFDALIETGPCGGYAVSKANARRFVAFVLSDLERVL